MARINGHRRAKMTFGIVKIILVFNIFSLYKQLTDAVESHGQVFIQTDNELRYMVDGVPLQVLPGQSLPDIKDNGGTLSTIKFHPLLLDFDTQPVGMPIMEQVTVQNPDSINSLHLLSISGSTQHFHCSFFQDKMVPPGGNTTFDVVFLAREIGNVENTLYIHTSQGTYKYQVFGVGISNPYRLRPLLGARVPLNSSYSPLIHMHNPHGSALQVTEMYSSGGDLHLELPTGEQEAPKKLWEIQPYETKPVMRASFVGRIEQNHTAYIRIKTDHDKSQQMLVLPIEVEVSSAPGLYTPTELLDFGILRTLDSPKSLKLNVVNSCSKPIHITSVQVVPPNDAISIEFRPIKVPADSVMRPSTIATITYTASKAINLKQWSGKIIVKSKNTQHKLTIPYEANVLHGSLAYNESLLRFYVGKPPFNNETRNLTITNTFNVSIVIYNVSLPDEVYRYFAIANFSGPVILKPQESIHLMTLYFLPDTNDLHFSVPLTFNTNASAFHLPVIVYNGKLKLVHHRPEIYEGQLDFGTLGMDEERSMTFTLRNDNPVDLVITEYRANLRKTGLELLGIEKGNGTALTKQHNVSEIQTYPLILRPYHFAVFSVNLVAPDYEATFAAEVKIVTQYQTLYIPMTLRTAEGSIQAVPEKTIFEKVFPGKVPYKILKLRSTFETYMEVERVYFQPNDTRFYWEPPKNSPIMLEPEQDTIVGKLYFDAKKECYDDCYVGLPTYIPAGHQWLLGLQLNKDVADIDQYLYTRFWQKWDIFGLMEQSTVNVTVQVDISDIHGFLFPAQVHFHWPSFLDRSRLRFPLTQIGNYTKLFFDIENPSDMPVLIQILPLPIYPNPQTIVDMLSPRLSTCLSDYIEMDDPDIFTLQNLEEYDPLPDNPALLARKYIAETLGVKTHNKTIGFILAPRAAIRTYLAFRPKDDVPRTSLIVIRNNLTIIDALVVHGQGAYGELRFSNQKAGSPTPLLFELNKTHLQNCEKKKLSKNHMPNYTVKRTFTIKNTGELAVFVHGYSINGLPCEGYGYRVLDCESFNLHPGQTKKIDLAFTPDFTMSRIRHTLSLHSSLGKVMNYTLQATIPPHFLSKCSVTLPRPPWEHIIYYSVVSTTVFFLFCVLVASYFESERIFQADILIQSHLLTNGQFDRSKIFDLRRIAGFGTKKDYKISNHIEANLTNGSADMKDKKEIIPTGNHHNPKNTPSVKNNFTENLKPLYERQSSREKEVKNNHHHHHIAPVHVKANNEKLNVVNCTNENVKFDGKQRRKQCTKRSISKEESVANTDAIEKKATIKETTDKESTKKLTDCEQANNEKNNKINNSKLIKENGKPNSGPTTPDVDVAVVTNDLSFENEFGKKEGKAKVKRKSKTALRREEKERREKEKLSRKEMVDNDKDDASSTTTESSSMDNDDKNSSTGCLTPEPQFPKQTKMKMKQKGQKLSAENDIGNLNGGAGDTENLFELLAPKSKSRRSKTDKNLRPNEISLPYTPHQKPEEKEVMKEVPTSPHTIAADAASKAALKAVKGRPTKHKSDTRSIIFDTDSDMGKDSPPPIWEMPKPVPKSGDLSELALQTQQFVLRQNKYLPDSLSPDNLSNPSRSSSFSSVISSNSSGTDVTKKNHRDADARMPLMSAFMPLSDGRQNGLVPTSSPGPIGSRLTTSSWNTRASSPISSETNPFHLDTIREQRPVARFANNAFANPTSGFGAQDVNSMNSQPATMMQRLQAERRQRLLEYHQKMNTNTEEWPGFGIQSPVQSSAGLWDSNSLYAPQEPWSTLTDSPPKPSASNLWANDSPAGANTSWDSVSSLWPNPGSAETSSLMESTNGHEEHGTSPDDLSSTSPGIGNFDPFNSLGSIWGPSNNNGGSNWGFPKPEK